MLDSTLTTSILLSFLLVCKDGSCNGDFACTNAKIGSVVGPSCTGVGGPACANALLSGVDLIDSCNEFNSCDAANGNGEIAELIDCCNDQGGQCQVKVGRIDIVAAGGPSCVSLMSNE